jgi:hypothetical protein
MSIWGCTGNLRGMARRIGFSSTGALGGAVIGQAAGSVVGMAGTFMYNRKHPNAKKSLWMHGATLGGIKGGLLGAGVGGLGMGWKR